MKVALVDRRRTGSIAVCKSLLCHIFRFISSDLFLRPGSRLASSLEESGGYEKRFCELPMASGPCSQANPDDDEYVRVENEETISLVDCDECFWRIFPVSITGEYFWWVLPDDASTRRFTATNQEAFAPLIFRIAGDLCYFRSRRSLVRPALSGIPGYCANKPVGWFPFKSGLSCFASRLSWHSAGHLPPICT